MNFDKYVICRSLFGGFQFVVLLLLSMGAAHAGTVSFCFSDWPPYSMMKDGEAQGVSIEILKQAAQRADLKPSFQELPWNRCLQMVKAGEIDAVIDAAKRKEYLQGDITHSVYTNTFWVRADDPVKEIDIEHFNGRSIGLVAGYKYAEPLDSILADARLKKEYSKDDTTNIRKLSFGRIDVIIGDYVGTRSFADKNGLSLRPILPSYSVDRLYPSFNLQKSDVHERLNEGLRAITKEGIVDAIYKRALGITFTALSHSTRD